jgi:hypothetical protein
MRVDESCWELVVNASESWNSHQLSSSFDRGFIKERILRSYAEKCFLRKTMQNWDWRTDRAVKQIMVTETDVQPRSHRADYEIRLA